MQRARAASILTSNDFGRGAPARAWAGFETRGCVTELAGTCDSEIWIAGAVLIRRGGERPGLRARSRFAAADERRETRPRGWDDERREIDRRHARLALQTRRLRVQSCVDCVPDVV